MNQIFPGFLDFSIFFYKPLFVEVVFPEKAVIRVSLVITFTVEAFEQMRA